MDNKNGVLETIIDEIMEHDRLHSDHGVGCACHDRHAGRIRSLFRDKQLLNPEHRKSLQNLFVVFGYVTQ